MARPSSSRTGAGISLATSLLLAFATFSLAMMDAKAAEARSEFIFERAPFRECHASTIVEIAGGDFLAAWFGGTAEGESDVAIWMSRLSRGRWSAPAQVAREPGVPAWNPVLFRGRDDRIWLFYKVGPSPETWTGAYKTSTDNGRTWSETTYLAAGLLGPIKDKPIRLLNGDIVAGSSVESYRSWAGWVERSTDEGKTWTRPNRHSGPAVWVDPADPPRAAAQSASALRSYSPGVYLQG